VSGSAPLTAGRVDASETISRIKAIAQALGADAIQREASALADRVAEGRFYVACVGQVKRGKSTLLNALLGGPVLPTGVLPVTAVPIVVRHASAPAARVELADGRSHPVPLAALPDYVTEAGNPANRRGVVAVEVGYPAPLLAGGLCLVDTPGIGSVFAANTDATRAFVPQIDAALVVVGVDPPVSKDELELIADVAAHVRDIVVVLGKADRFSADERRAAGLFARRVIEERIGRSVEAVFELSGADRLAGGTGGADWLALETRLARLEREAGRDLVRARAARGAARLITATLAEIGAQRAALLQPVEESRRRLAGLRATVDDAAQRALELSHLFTAEEQRLSRLFAERREAFIAEAAPRAASDLEAAARALAVPRTRLRRAARDEARRIGLALVEPWLQSEGAEAERQYLAVANRFIALANGFLDRIAATDADEFARMPRRIEFDGQLRIESRYYFHRLDPLLYGIGGQRLLDAVRTRRAAERSVIRQMVPYLRDLLAINATRVSVDLHERVVESRRRLEAEIQQCLHDVYVAAERGIQRAAKLRSEGEARISLALEHLDALEREVRMVGAELT
jgi:GTP-binding protein EngB required for normal cell division